MTRAQSILRSAATRVCQASAWLDPRRTGAPEESAQIAIALLHEARLMLEQVEMTLAVNAAAQEATCK